MQDAIFRTSILSARALVAGVESLVIAAVPRCGRGARSPRNSQCVFHFVIAFAGKKMDARFAFFLFSLKNAADLAQPPDRLLCPS